PGCEGSGTLGSTGGLTPAEPPEPLLTRCRDLWGVLFTLFNFGGIRRLLAVEGNAQDVVDEIPDFFVAEYAGEAGHLRSGDPFVPATKDVDGPAAAAVDPARQIARLLRVAPVVMQPGLFVEALRLGVGNLPEFLGVAAVAAPRVAMALEAFGLLSLHLRQEQL